MSSSKELDFSDTDLESLSLWQLPELDSDGNPVKIEKASETTALQLTVTEIEAMQKQAYDEAFALGKSEGNQQGYEEGFQSGHKEGSAKGYEEASQIMQEKVNDFTRIMETLSEPLKNLDEEVERELVKLATGVAAQIIRREIKLDAGQVVAAVREAIKVLPLSSQKISLFLHPEDAELVRSVLALDDLSPAWVIVEDPLITRGGCKVDTEVSHIDATVENRLAAVVSAVFGSERERDRGG